MMSTYSYEEHVALYPELTLAQRQRLGVWLSGAPLEDDRILDARVQDARFIAPRATHRLVDRALAASIWGVEALMGSRRDAPARSAELVGALLYDVYGEQAPQGDDAAQLIARWAQGAGRALYLSQASAGDLICWRPPSGAGRIGVVCGRSEAGLLLVVESSEARGGRPGLHGYKLREGAPRSDTSRRDAIIVARRPEG